MLIDGVIPGQIEQRAIPRISRSREALLELPAELVEEMQLAAAVTRRLDRLVVPLQHPLGLGEAALLLHMRRGREEEDLGRDALGAQLFGRDLGRVLPERG